MGFALLDPSYGPNMNYVTTPRFVLFVATLLLAKLIFDINRALTFIFNMKDDIAGTGLEIIAIILLLATFIFALRLLFLRRWAESALLIIIIFSVVISPSIPLFPGYWKFQRNKSTYLAAISADPSPHPKFHAFLMADIGNIGGGGTFYFIVYDGTDEVGLTPANRTTEWTVAHPGFGSGLYPPSQRKICHLEGHFYLLVETS